MAELLPKAVQNLIRVFSKFPGVGKRTATRFVLDLVRDGDERFRELRDVLELAMDEVKLCKQCYGLAESKEICRICSDPGRGGKTLCIVESIADQLAVESAGNYSGRYFVLHRLLSPLRGVGPDDLNLGDLSRRINEEEIVEVIVATPMTTDGETTATYIKKMLAPLDIPVSRLASGVPMGGSIEYLDQLTLGRALRDRKEY